MSQSSSTSIPRPCDIRHEYRLQRVETAIAESEFEDVAPPAIADVLDMDERTARTWIHELLDQDRIEMTRTVCHAKLYRVSDPDPETNE